MSDPSPHGRPATVPPSSWEWLLLLAAVVVGSILRLYQIRDQIILDDEWHALHAAALLSPMAILSLITLGASSIPLNLYCRLLLDGPGWNEMTLRLPSLSAGLGALLVFPFLAWGLFRPRIVAFFTALIALSPFLVFYSRYLRPYSIVVLLTFVSLISAYRWVLSGKTKDAALFAASGLTAAYFHLPEIRAIFLPLVLLIGLKLWSRTRPFRIKISPSIRALLTVAVLSVLILALLYGPGFVSGERLLSPVLGSGRADASMLLGFSELLSGTSCPLVRGVFVVLAAIGLVLCWKQHPLLAALSVVVVVASIGMVLWAQPLDSEKLLTFTRYAIAVFPVVMLLIAIGADGVLRWVEKTSPLARLPTALAVAFGTACGFAALFWAGPLPTIYAGRNSFTNHKIFQSAYDYVADGRRGSAPKLVIGDVLVPAFYDRLVADDGCDAVIEYPLPVADRYSPYYLHQARHQKRVLGGYFHQPRPDLGDDPPGIAAGDGAIDGVLDRVQDPTRLRFYNLVNLADPAAIHASGACYLIVHAHPEAERLGNAESIRRSWPGLPPGRFGQPAYSDALTTVFDLRRNGP